MNAVSARLVPIDRLHSFCVQALTQVGVSERDAATTVDALVTTDTWGVFTHGTKLLHGYVKRLQAGGLRTDVSPSIAAEGPAWAIVDGASTLGQVAATLAIETAIGKARSAGIAYVGVRNTCHCGAMGYYTSLAAQAGLIGVSMANDIPTVVAPGSRGGVTGSNPLSYSVPAGRHDPILLDISIATVAGGKVYAARQKGEAIPSDWIIGPDGLPTTDSSLYPQTASLVPMAGHKGYGLALLIETLAAVLSGAAITHGVGNWIFGDFTQPTLHGGAFIAIDVATMMEPQQFAARVDALIDEIHAAPVAEGTQRILVPGETEWRRRRQAVAEGIPLPSDVVDSLRGLAEDLKLREPFEQLFREETRND
ncbi:MAG: Ldh family oxidoreductase [Gemmatimonadales bacterium]|nr:Ldh family oxidoreductase [Gemmatimonadales bacterium]